MVDRSHSRLSLLLPLLFLYFALLSSSLEVTSASPCRSLCATSDVRTTVDDIVCFDDEFATTTNGTNFRGCIECELGSTAVESDSGATDVTWGLYNLRYALSTCLFGIPFQKISISTPCQVSCEPLKDALGHNLNNSAAFEDLSYCNIPSFQDTARVNRCAQCYGRMDDEAYMANFLQALHIACLQPPRPSQAFPVAANTIFNSTPIATPSPSSTAVSGSSKPANLALIISLPVVFGMLILAGVIGCCFYSARHRRRIMAERNAMRRIQDKSSPTFPPDHQHDQQYQQQSQQNQLHPQSPQGFDPAPLPSPVYFSPISDRKENPYIQLQPQTHPPQQVFPPQPQYPTIATTPYPHRSYSYSPADYAQNPPTSTTPLSQSVPIPLDTSLIGPGPTQTKLHNLHDQYFPPPPPPPPNPPQQPPSHQVAMPPPPMPLPQEGIEALRQHHMNTPSLSMPVPRGKKSLEERRKLALRTEPSEEGGIQLQDYKGGEGGVRDGGGGESPQVFVYDESKGRYVRET